MVALASRLRARGTEATIVTPGPTPESLAFVYGDLPVFVATDPASRDPLDSADAIAVLDTAERSRIRGVVAALDRAGGVLIDHHPPIGDPIAEPSIRDPDAAATGELVFDLLGLEGEPVSRFEADALYVAITTDTGSFQFSNTSARTHEIAAALLRAGVDPSAMYRDLHGTLTRTGLTLLRHALSRLEVDPLSPVAWVAVDHEVQRDLGARSDDFEGLVDYPRRLAGIEVGLFFRALSSGRTKVSLRSNGDVDVSDIAQALGGGGHRKAAGIVLETGLEEAIRTVVERVRSAARAVRDDDGG